MSAAKEGQKFERKMSGRRGKLVKRTSISDLEDPEEREWAQKFDVDGDGFLDETEMAMMKQDTDKSGHLSNDEIYAIVTSQLAARKDVNVMRKAIAGLVCFIFILALSNLGTSMASAILAKETKADAATGTMQVIGTGETLAMQSSGETFDLESLSIDERRARRALVVAEVQADPLGNHAHRRLAKKNKNDSSCKKKSSMCDTKLTFDSGKLKQDDLELLLAKCDGVKTVNIKRKFSDGELDTNSLCRPGTSIVVKGPKKKGTYVDSKKKTRTARDVVITTEGKTTNFDCNGKDCYISGTSLLQGVGEPCDLAHGDDDCEEGLLCYSQDRFARTGTCLRRDDFGQPWYVSENFQNCVQDCDVGPNCGGYAENFNEMFPTAEMCCGNMLSYMNFKVCVPDWTALDSKPMK